MATYDLKNRVSVVNSMSAAAYTTVTNGASADLAGYEGALVIYHIGASGGDQVFKMQESDNDSTFTNVTASDQSTTLVAIDTTNDDTIYTAAYLGRKRYLRVALTTYGTSLAAACSIVRFPGRHVNA